MMELKKRRNAYLMFLLLCLIAAAAIAGMSALLYQSNTSEQNAAEGSKSEELAEDGSADDGNKTAEDNGGGSGNTADAGDGTIAGTDNGTDGSGKTASDTDQADGTDDGTLTADGSGNTADGSENTADSANLADGSRNTENGSSSNTADAADGTDGSAGGDSLAASGQISESLLAEKISAYSFAAGTIIWPVEGDICLEYDMEHTIYFSTLDLYRCNPGVCIRAEAGTAVSAGVDGVVTNVTEDSFYGTMVTVALGNDYELTYGQLADVSVGVGDEVRASTQIGAVAEPTIYFTEEGAHLFLELTVSGETVDPLDYLNY